MQLILNNRGSQRINLIPYLLIEKNKDEYHYLLQLVFMNIYLSIVYYARKWSDVLQRFGIFRCYFPKQISPSHAELIWTDIEIFYSHFLTFLEAEIVQ